MDNGFNKFGTWVHLQKYHLEIGEVSKLLVIAFKKYIISCRLRTLCKCPPDCPVSRDDDSMETFSCAWAAVATQPFV